MIYFKIYRKKNDKKKMWNVPVNVGTCREKYKEKKRHLFRFIKKIKWKENEKISCHVVTRSEQLIGSSAIK